MAGMPVKSRPSNLPAELTSFVGRRRELSEVKRLLTTTRLLTLTGSGGAGKTRLALRAAAEIARGFPDGVWLVSLASIDDPKLVVQAVFTALGLQDTSTGWSLSTLSSYLAHRNLLLVLDNCEHLLDSCAVLAVTLLKSCPGLHVLATSREPLGVTGETRMRVPSLSLPPEGAELTPDRMTTYEAVALLAERAAAVQRGFRVDDANATAVLALCRRLDGMPLALELAAVRLEGLTVQQVLSGLQGELPVLGQGSRGVDARQATLDATINWSYRLLEPQERLLWARLSVFAGSFDLEAALHVCSGAELLEGQVMNLVATLVEKSILKREAEDHHARYMLLETLRQFGRQRLRELGDEEVETQRRHRDWVLEFAKDVGAWDHRQAEAFNRVYRERDNLWAALDFCVRQPGEAERGIEIARNVYPCWTARGPLNDARRVIRSLLERATPESLARARGLFLTSTLAWSQGDLAEAISTAEESLHIGRLLGDDDVVSRVLVTLGIVTWVDGRRAEAFELLTDALELARKSSNWKNIIAAQSGLCGVLLAAGDVEGAAAAGEGAVTLSLGAGELWVRGIVLGLLAEARWRLGDWDRAMAALRDGVACKHALEDRIGLAALLEMMGWMVAERGLAEQAAAVLGCAAALRESVAAPILAPFVAQHDAWASSVRNQLGDEAYSAAFERGRAMPIEDVMVYALDQRQPKRPLQPSEPKVRTDVGSPIVLTRRELEIARLIAEGLTSAQIGAKLVISERTVTTHVTNMLNKLGLSSRIQLASWVTRSQPVGAKDT